jgi:hypothetical protein
MMRFLEQCYTTCDSANPAKSLDFGAEGYTASLTDWHELLQITSPDPTCGIVYVRGSFPDNPEAILARSQRRDDLGDKGTFGLQIQPQPFEKGRTDRPSALERDERVAHGLVNFRWPYSQYELRRKTENGEFELGEAGTCEAISWVKNGTLFQALRLNAPPQDANAHLKIRIGGNVRFGCPCTNKPQIGNNQLETEDGSIRKLTSDGLQLSSISSQYCQYVEHEEQLEKRLEKRLEIQLFIDGQRQKLEIPANAAVCGYNCKEIYLLPRQPRTIVATFKLVDEEPYTAEQLNNPARFSKDAFNEAESDLGIADDSFLMTDRLWTACVPSNYTAIQAKEFCALARCVEQIMGVMCVPISPESGAALVYNIITAQYVDLQSTL